MHGRVERDMFLLVRFQFNHLPDYCMLFFAGNLPRNASRVADGSLDFSISR
jgi:hypothetical protein